MKCQLDLICDGDTILYKNQIGTVVDIYDATDEQDVKYKIKIVSPDNTLVVSKEEIQLLYPVG